MTKAEIASRRAVHRQAKVPSLRFQSCGQMGSENLDQDGDCVNSGSNHPIGVWLDPIRANLVVSPAERLRSGQIVSFLLAHTIRVTTSMLDWFPMLLRRFTGRLWISFLFALVTTDAIAAAGLAQTQSADPLAVGPVAVWPAGPIEVVAAFDRALDPSVADGLVGKTISYHESSTPVSDRSAARPLGALRIVGVRLTDGGRTLSLATDPHPRMARYVLPLLPPKSDKGAKSTVATRTAYDLGGVEVTWSPEGDPDERSRWSGWWPLLDLEATAAVDPRLTPARRRNGSSH